MGFPAEMFTVLFALGRLPGWIAQWREMMADPATKIGRPRQVYTGAAERSYVQATFRRCCSRDGPFFFGPQNAAKRLSRTRLLPF